MCSDRWKSGVAGRIRHVRTALAIVAAVLAVAALVATLSSPTGSARPRVRCKPRAGAIAQAPATLVRRSVVPGTGGQLQQIILRSPAMAADVPLYVLLPARYRASGAARYPVLYLLHGAGDSYQSWIDQGVRALIDQETSVDHLAPFITVMPDGGHDGFFSDWLGEPAGASSPPPAYATYDIHELIPWIDGHFRTLANRQDRAIAGLSMGGFGAMSYAAQHPDLFGVAVAFSGAVDTDLDYPADPERLNGAALNACMWGDPVTDAVNWRAVDPTYLASNLDGVSLFLASGTGEPRRFDRPAGASGGYSSTEALIWQMNLRFAAALTAAGIDFRPYFYGPGSHSWPYWLRDLRHLLPDIDRAFADPLPAPPRIPFDYRTVAPTFTIWGWRFSCRHRGREFTYLAGVTRTGFAVSGSGTLAVTTAPVYAARRAYRISVAGARPVNVRSDRHGRISFTVALGRGQTAPQAHFPPAGPPAGWRTVVVAIATAGLRGSQQASVR
jgi:S-formylglutathione hydrolase FrmB